MVGVDSPILPASIFIICSGRFQDLFVRGKGNIRDIFRWYRRCVLCRFACAAFFVALAQYILALSHSNSESNLEFLWVVFFLLCMDSSANMFVCAELTFVICQTCKHKAAHACGKITLIEIPSTYTYLIFDIYAMAFASHERILRLDSDRA